MCVACQYNTLKKSIALSEQSHLTLLVKPTSPPKVPRSAPVWQQPLEKPHSSPEVVAAQMCWADHDPWWMQHCALCGPYFGQRWTMNQDPSPHFSLSSCYSSIDISGLTGIDLWIWMCYSRYWDEQIIKSSKINRRLGNRNDITRNKHTHIAIKGDHISAKQWEQEVWRHINLHPDAWF